METNWAGNVTYRARQIHTPASIDDLRRIVSTAKKIRALGGRHSFNEIADSEELISLRRIAPDIVIDEQLRTVSCGAACSYTVLADKLENAGWALPNLASLPHVSVGGAIATATHGSGDHNGNLATTVEGLELVTAGGDLISVDRESPDFNGMVVHLGALGIVTRLTLRIEPSFQVRQQVFEGMAWDVLLEHFDEIMASGYSVSIFTPFGDTIDGMWRKQRIDPGDDRAPDTEFMGTLAAARNLHPIPALDATGCTDQLGKPGPWLYRLPHFWPDSIPASGNEIQAEYMMARKHAVPAIAALREIGLKLKSHLLTSETRTVAGDDLWLSTAFGGDTVCLHFSFRFEPAAVAGLALRIEETLAPFSPRPHWGKHFAATASELAPRYPRMADFHALAKGLDPGGKFRNAFLDRHVFG